MIEGADTENVSHAPRRGLTGGYLLTCDSVEQAEKLVKGDLCMWDTCSVRESSSGSSGANSPPDGSIARRGIPELNGAGYMQ